MEDQQLAEGDLTDKSSDEPEVQAACTIEASDTVTAEKAEAGQTDSGKSGTAEQEGAAVGTETGAADVAEQVEAAGRNASTGKPIRRWLTVAVAVAALMFVGSAAFAGATAKSYLTDRTTAATKLRVARTAANAITTLWTYTPENMDSLADRAASYLSGDFEVQYRRFVDAIVAPNKQAKITNSTEVIGVAVESLDNPSAIAMVYTNTTSTSPLTKNIPSLKYLSYRLFMTRTDGRWVVTRMTTITSLDLTPHL